MCATNRQYNFSVHVLGHVVDTGDGIGNRAPQEKQCQIIPQRNTIFGGDFSGVTCHVLCYIACTALH